MKVLFLKDYGGIFEVGDVRELSDEQAEMLIEPGYCKPASPKEVALKDSSIKSPKKKAKRKK